MRWNVFIFSLIFLIYSIPMWSARTKQSVRFSVQMPNQNMQTLPFIVHVPNEFTGALVRFVHPKTGQSAVARVVKRGGDSFSTNPELATAIGLKTDVATLFIEDVY